MLATPCGNVAPNERCMRLCRQGIKPYSREKTSKTTSKTPSLAPCRVAESVDRRPNSDGLEYATSTLKASTCGAWRESTNRQHQSLMLVSCVRTDNRSLVPGERGEVGLVVMGWPEMSTSHNENAMTLAVAVLSQWSWRCPELDPLPAATCGNNQRTC